MSKVPSWAIAAGVAVFVFWLFGAIAVDRKNAAELLNDVRTGSRNQRWQSAFELTKKLPALTDPKERAAFSAAALRAYEGAENDDPRVRRYLTLVLGRLGDPRAVPLLEKALGDKDPETRLYALWALALVGDPGSAPRVRRWFLRRFFLKMISFGPRVWGVVRGGDYEQCDCRQPGRRHSL